jgi:hypothetical protein
MNSSGASSLRRGRLGLKLRPFIDGLYMSGFSASRFLRNIHRSVSADNSVDVSESEGVRSLHLGSSTVQSSMRLSTPYDLELTYTRGIMMFLLFAPDVRKVLAIGLGGGSIPNSSTITCRDYRPPWSTSTRG